MVFCLLAVFLAVAPARFQAPDDTRSAVVSGRVVDAISGRPVSGVVVTPAGSAVPVTPGSPLPPRALTNGQGEFVLRGLRKGTVYFTAEKSGYAGATYKQRRPGGSGQGVPIEDGQGVTGLEIRMWRHAAISGTVLDEAGEPAVGVRVQAFPRGFVAGRRRYTPGPTTTTDDRGMYRIPNLMPGDYAIAVPSTQKAVPTETMDVIFGSGGATEQRRAEVSRELNSLNSAIVPAGSRYALAIGNQTFTLPSGTLMPQPRPDGGLIIYPTLFYPAASGAAQATAVTVRSGEERGSIDLQMRPTRAGRVSGTVIGPDGPASHVGIRLVPAAEDRVESLEVATTMSDASGGFTRPAVPPGQFVVSILRIPREPVDVDGGARIAVTPGGNVTIGTAVPAAPAGTRQPPPIPSDATLYAQLPVSVGGSDLSDVIVTLAAAPRVSGRVEFEGTADKPAGSALAGIRINLDPADGSRLPDQEVSFRAGHPDEDGRFGTFGVLPGAYVLRVNPPKGWFLKGALAGTTDISDLPFDLGAKDLTGVVITFTDRPSGLSGKVRSDQRADPDAVVVAFPTDRGAWASRGAFPRRMQTARADRDGSYTMNGLLPGEYYVAAVHEDAFADWQDPSLLDALTRVAQTVRIVDGEQRTLDLGTSVIR